MPAHQMTIDLPGLRWERLKSGVCRFEAGDEDRGFAATLSPATGHMRADYWHDGDGGRGEYAIDSADDLAAKLGDLLLYVAGFRCPTFLADLAGACVRDGQLPLPGVDGEEAER